MYTLNLLLQRFMAIISVLFFLQMPLLSQGTCNCSCEPLESDTLASDTLIEGIWGLEFCNSAGKEIPISKTKALFTYLNVKFSKDGCFDAEGFNYHYGLYTMNQGHFNIITCGSTLVYTTISTKNGKKIDIPFFYEIFKSCNRYYLKNKRLYLYQDSLHLITLKPIKEFFDFPARPGVKENTRIITPLLSDAKFDSGYVIVDNIEIQNKFKIRIDFEIDYSKTALLIIKNVELQKNKILMKELNRKYRRNISRPILPVSYLKVYHPNDMGVMYVDVVQKFFNKSLYDNRRNEYLCLIIDKSLAKKLWLI
ncbi:MAG: hypothetical protein MI922_28500 [Bacteroidales bacterium]|nr:hypothetical protein [Bacteroidales bacterium]